MIELDTVDEGNGTHVTYLHACSHNPMFYSDLQIYPPSITLSSDRMVEEFHEMLESSEWFLRRTQYAVDIKMSD